MTETQSELGEHQSKCTKTARNMLMLASIRRHASSSSIPDLRSEPRFMLYHCRELALPIFIGL